MKKDELKQVLVKLEKEATAATQFAESLEALSPGFSFGFSPTSFEIAVDTLDKLFYTTLISQHVFELNFNQNFEDLWNQLESQTTTNQ